MSKQMITIIADEDIIDELACYPDERCVWLTELVDISDEEFEKYINDGNSDTYGEFWDRVSDEMHDEIIKNGRR